jgi:hypothetical protein
MVPVVRAWITMGAEEGVAVHFETHRNCITNDLFTNLQLLDAIPELTLCADLSHMLVDREFWYPISSENQAFIHRLLERSACFQGPSPRASRSRSSSLFRSTRNGLMFSRTGGKRAFDTGDRDPTPMPL